MRIGRVRVRIDSVERRVRPGRADLRERPLGGERVHVSGDRAVGDVGTVRVVEGEVVGLLLRDCLAVFSEDVEQRECPVGDVEVGDAPAVGSYPTR